jgi:hypothetical protein
MACFESKFAELKQEDFYIENGRLVFTEQYHLKRGYCCGSGCRHCPYEPRHIENNRNTQVEQASGACRQMDNKR